MHSNNGVSGNYWSKRKNMMYYKYIDFLVKAFSMDAKDLLDVGSANAEYIEQFFWIPQKFALDINRPYSSPNVIGIEEDFFKFNPNHVYDFVICSQVLEHIDEVERFSRKLLSISKKLLISVPYKWRENTEEGHINDPVDLDKVMAWFGKEPSYHIIVEEPLRNKQVGKHRRLICLFQEEKINYKQALLNVRELERNQFMNTMNVENIIIELKEVQAINQKIFEAQIEVREKKFEHNNLTQENKLYQEEISKLENNIKVNNEKITHLNKNRNKLTKKADQIKNSRSWKVTNPIRKIKKFFK